MLDFIKFAIAKHQIRSRLRKRLKSADFQEADILLLNVPSHGNLGDHLICLAEMELIKDVSGRKPFQLTTGELLYGFDIVKRHVIDSQTLAITGGGFLGSVWPMEQLRVCDIFNSFPDNNILILPQTIIYDNDIESQKLKEISSQSFRSHNHSHICVREKRSYEVAIGELRLSSDKILLLPDAALYLNFSRPRVERHGVILCLRDDKEMLTDNSLKRDLIELISQSSVYKYLDTYKSYAISQDAELCEIEALVEDFKRAQVVITDRLHGMIYAVITGTPVIAFDNATHKVGNVYKQWLSDLSYVKFVDGNNDIYELRDWMHQVVIEDYDNREIVKKLQTIANCL